MTWIKTIPYANAEGALKKIYDRVKGPDNNVDNVLSIHSLRPHTLTGHMTLYKSVLHNSKNTLPKWYLEALGVYVSYLNKCDYCVQHHFAGFSRLIADQEKAEAFLDAVQNDSATKFYGNKYDEGMAHAAQLTLNHSSISKSNIDNLVRLGFTEGEVLEINQVTCYFNYVNRMVVGLGVNTQGDIIGLSPGNSEQPNDWNHN